MNFDVRFPIGALLALYGVLLLAYGTSQRSLPVVIGSLNADVAWGLVLLLAGMLLSAAAWSRRRRQ